MMRLLLQIDDAGMLYGLLHVGDLLPEWLKLKLRLRCHPNAARELESTKGLRPVQVEPVHHMGPWVDKS
jgi:hypothetical protein